MPDTVKLLIVDQSLRDLNGHHLAYDVGVARGALMLKATPVIAAHVDFDATLVGHGLEVRRTFQRAWNEVHYDRTTRLARSVLSNLPPPIRGPMIRAASVAKQSLAKRRCETVRQAPLPTFGAELVALIDSERLTRTDHVFIHTLSMAELHALVAQCRDRADLPWVHIVLRRDANEKAVRDDSRGGISGAFNTINGLDQLKTRLRFYVDTEHLCGQYEALSGGLPVGLLPIPHDLPDRPMDRRTVSGAPACLTYLGNARTEKGFQHLPPLVEAQQRDFLDTGRTRFVIQSNSNMSLEDETIAIARRRLAAFPKRQVELIREAPSIAEFHQRLTDSDLILLPYDRESYRRRSSGIMVQALVSGRPVVVPAGTWMADCAPPGSFVAFDGPADLPRAVAEAVDGLEQLTSAAHAAAPAWRREHDARLLVQRLFSVATAAP